MSNTEILLVALIFAVIAVFAYLEHNTLMHLKRIERWCNDIDASSEQAERELRNHTGD